MALSQDSLGLGFPGLQPAQPPAVAPIAKPIGPKKNPKLKAITQPKGTGALKVPKGPKGPGK